MRRLRQRVYLTFSPLSPLSRFENSNIHPFGDGSIIPLFPNDRIVNERSITNYSIGIRARFGLIDHSHHLPNGKKEREREQRGAAGQYWFQQWSVSEIEGAAAELLDQITGTVMEFWREERGRERKGIKFNSISWGDRESGEGLESTEIILLGRKVE